MSKHIHKIWIVVLCFFAMQQYMLGQVTRPFTYGGNDGKRNGGKIKIAFFLENGGRLQKLEGNVIDLNNYSRNVKLIVRCSNLETGLNASGTKVKNSDHGRRYYMKAAHQSANLLSLLGSQTVEIGSGGSHYGNPEAQLTYKINPVTSQRSAALKIKTFIVDANAGKRWRAVTISKSLSLLPRNSDIANSAWSPVKKLWEEVNKKNTTENKKRLLEKCIEYLRNCEDGIYSSCNQENALYYMIKVTEGKQQEAYIKEYHEKYPKGKYKDEIEKIIEEQSIEEQPDIPIEPGARLDFDANYIVLNNVSGGKKPYRLKFFNNKERDSLPHSSYSFSKDHDYIHLKSLNIPKGVYTVVVTDSKEKEFTSKSGIHIRQAFQIDPGIRLAGILLLLGALGVAYKKYIHF